MRIRLACVLALLSCDGGSDNPRDSGVDITPVDAPEMAPMITSFVPSPSTVTAGVPTSVTWTWTYAIEPTLPDPTCTIDNGVGAIARGQATMVTLTAVTTFTLTCTNRVGSASRQVVLAVPPVAPVIATFTATPAMVPSNTATSVQWSWTYANTPSPAPTCTIEHGVGTVTSGSSSSVTLTQARTYRLRCTNTSGSGVSQATVSVDECTAATHDCQVNATCVDSVDSFTCACKAGYVGNGDVCNTAVACSTPGTCDANATCVNGTSCACNSGYVGDGLTCQRLRIAFVTSTTGSGNLSTWTGAGGNTGVAAADAVCNARAAAAGLPGTYVAWMSDSLSDAYCRAHGLTGKKVNNCGQVALPAAAGPWARPSTGADVNRGQAIYPTVDKLLAPTRATYLPASFTESGVEVTVTDRVYTGTDDTGVLTGTACSDWTSAVSTTTGAMGEVNGGGTSWTDLGTDPGCNTLGRLRCVEVSTTGPTTPGTPLPSRHPTAKKAFLTSVSGNGNLSTWADAGGTTGLAAADSVCQARARYAGYANSANFKAYLSSSTSVSTRILTNGPWARPDGVVIATSEVDLEDSKINAPLYLTETGTYVAGNAETGNVWTGTSGGSATFVYCSLWTLGTSSTGSSGRHDLVDTRWLNAASNSCTLDQRLYCVED